MSIPKEPRQQMINLMYLVLTAMLALNVSAEILRAFKLVNDSLISTNETVEETNKGLYKDFKEEFNRFPERTKDFYLKAQLTHQYSDSLFYFIDGLKNQLIDAGGNNNNVVDEDDFYEVSGEKRYKGESDQNVSSTILLVKEGGIKGQELRTRIGSTLDNLYALLPEDRDKLNLPLNYPNNPPAFNGIKKSWQESLFEEVPLTAAVTMLSKLQTDIRNSEGEILRYLFKKINLERHHVDRLEAKVTPRSVNVMQGSTYQSQIFLAAHSSTETLEIYIGDWDNLQKKFIGDSILLEVKDGIATYQFPVNTLGQQYYEGVIKVDKPKSSGKDIHYFRENYRVTASNAVVSPAAMNVLFIGLENPLDISVAGVIDEKVFPEMTKGRLIRSNENGRYNAKVQQQGKTHVKVYAELEDGSRRLMGSTEFRIKFVPDPIPMVGRWHGGKVNLAEFRAQRGLRAVLKDFYYDIRFRVIEYELTIRRKRNPDLLVEMNQGEIYNEKNQQRIDALKHGDVIYFSRIKVVGPDGRRRKLPEIIFEMK